MTYEQAITAYGRTFRATLTCVGGDTFTTNEATFTISEVMSANADTLSMGAAYSNRLDASIYTNGSAHDFRNNTVTVEIELWDEDTSAWFSPATQMGVFKVSEVSTSSDYMKVNIVAYDAMGMLMNEKYVPDPGVASFSDIVTDICTQYSLTLDSGTTVVTHPITVDELYESTVANMLGYIAGCGGRNAVINRSGKLEFRWYTDSAATIDSTATIEYGFTQRATQDFTVNSVTAGVGDEYVTVGTGKGITFLNPYITETEVQAIYDNVVGFSYLPCDVQWFGDPRRTVGDIVVVFDRNNVAHNCIISQQNISFNGGYRSTITSSGSDATSVAFDNTTSYQKTLQEIQRAYTSLQTAITNAMEVILNAQGVFVVDDANNDGINDGWTIWAQDFVRYIRATSGGIGFFNGNDVPQTAITFDGIVADAITTGHMSAERITVNGYGLNDYFRVANVGGTITVQIGDGANGLVLTQTGSKIAFTDTNGNDVAYWDAANSTFSMPRLNTFIIGGCVFREQSPGNLILEGA